MSKLSLLEKHGVLQRFEYSFELAWKVVKDFLEAGGLVLAPLTPRQVLKDAFTAKILADGQVWIDLLDEPPLPYQYDVQPFSLVKSLPLREHIERVGVTLYPPAGDGPRFNF